MTFRVKTFRSGMWWFAEDEFGYVWGMSAEGPLHACNEARTRRAQGKSDLGAEWLESYKGKSDE